MIALVSGYPTRHITLASIALLASAVLFTACGSDEPTGTPTPEPTTAQTGETAIAGAGDAVLVHYTGTLDDGSEFDSSLGRDPLGFSIGDGNMIKGFDAAVNGMALGEKRTVRIEAAAAYGERDDTRIFEVPLGQAPAGVSVGDVLGLSTGGRATVTAVTDETVTLDQNHALAGQALTFEIELVSINGEGA